MEEYLKAVPFLTPSEAEEAKRELSEEKEEHERAWTTTRLELLEEKERNRRLEEKMEAIWPLLEELKKRVLGPS